MIDEMKRLCDVPNCPREGTEEVNGGWMCRWDAMAWDKAVKNGGVHNMEIGMAADDDTPEDDIAAQEHAQWIGRRK